MAHCFRGFVGSGCHSFAFYGLFDHRMQIRLLLFWNIFRGHQDLLDLHLFAVFQRWRVSLDFICHNFVDFLLLESSIIHFLSRNQNRWVLKRALVTCFEVPQMCRQPPLHCVLRKLRHRVLFLRQACVLATTMDVLGRSLCSHFSLRVKNLFDMFLSLLLF